MTNQNHQPSQTGDTKKWQAHLAAQAKSGLSRSEIIPKSIATPGLLAHILTGKLIDHTPFYRQEKQFLRLGVELSRTTMCKWAMQAAVVCQPLLNLLTDEILAGFYMNIRYCPNSTTRQFRTRLSSLRRSICCSLDLVGLEN